MWSLAGAFHGWCDGCMLRTSTWQTYVTSMHCWVLRGLLSVQ